MVAGGWALIVGASRGLGLGLAAELQRRGWDVVGTVRDDAGARRVAALGRGLIVERLDTNDDAAITGLRHRLAGNQFDLVFVNAGIALAHDDPAATSRDEAAKILLTNALAPIRVAQAFLDRVRQPHGVLAFMSSELGSVANKTDDYGPLYSASKAALNSLTRSLAASLGGRRITVLSIAPGWVRTDMGGPGAPLSVEESVRGVVDVIERRAGSLRHAFVDYRDREVAW